MANFCQSCGAKSLSLAANFCASCGEPLKANLKAKSSILVEDEDDESEDFEGSGNYPTKLDVDIEMPDTSDFRRPMNEAILGSGGSLYGSRPKVKLSKKEKAAKKERFKNEVKETLKDLRGEE